MSLEVARSYYQVFWAIDKEFLTDVRKPLPDEVP